MSQFGKAILLIGALLVVIGALIWGVGRLSGDGARGLPGDIFYQGERVTVVFPIVTCLLISGVLTLLLWLWQWWGR